MAGKRPPRGTRIRALVAGIAAAGIVAALAPAASAATPARLGAAVVDRTLESPASVRAYWTRARTRAAQPAAVLGQKLAPRAARHRRVPASRRRAHRRTRIATRVHKIRRYPTRTHGKVFFSALGGKYECSGTAVRAQNQSLVLTAGHCAYLEAVMFGPNIIQNWEFIPAYANGRAPFGEWPATTLAAPDGWTSSGPMLVPPGEVSGGDERFDLGAATVAITGGQTLESRVGAARVAFNRPRHHRYKAFGYPATGRFAPGGREYSCASRYRGADRHFRKPPPIRIRCDMQGGSSGGGWMDPHGRLVSVGTYGYVGHPRSLYGPYFGTALRAFYDSVSR